MALLGFEVLHSTVSANLKSLDDAAIAAVHWNIISNGLKCCGSGESWPAEHQSGSEVLPAGWNGDGTVYSLRYIDPTSDRKYLLKVVAMDGSLIVHLIRCFDEKTVSTNIRSRDYVNDDYTSFKNAYTNLKEINSQLTKDLYKSIMATTSTTNPSPPKASSQSSSHSPHSSSNHRQPGRSPLMEDPRRGGVPPGGIGFTPPRHPFGASSVDPFSVGRADLDPLAGGLGGGMIMDPSGFPRPGGLGGGNRGPFGPGGQPGFPPGSVPPGARFDPVGPPGLRPNPDPDHERPPPDYDNMFM